MRRPRPVGRQRVFIVLTLVACTAALLLREPIRARWCAAQLRAAATPEARAACLQTLIASGPAARWGAAALLDDPDPAQRQYGLIVLHHLRTDWARTRLLATLRDADPGVRRLAAVGLAMHGDERVLPALRTLYSDPDPHAAAAACLALARLGTPMAVEVLAALASEPADPGPRAALIDALAEIATPPCAAPLLALLDDERPCEAPPPGPELAAQALSALRRTGHALAATLPADERTHTVAERAAATLARITRVPAPGPWTDLGPEDRARMRNAWRAGFDASRAESVPAGQP